MSTIKLTTGCSTVHVGFYFKAFPIAGHDLSITFSNPKPDPLFIEHEAESLYYATF